MLHEPTFFLVRRRPVMKGSVGRTILSLTCLVAAAATILGTQASDLVAANRPTGHPLVLAFMQSPQPPLVLPPNSLPPSSPAPFKNLRGHRP